jgi:MacB-like protein
VESGPTPRFGYRSLIRRPGFAVVSIITLALGIGAATAMFTVVNAILLTPLPFREPERLGIVRIQSTTGEEFPLPDTDFLAWRARHPAFDRVAVFAATRFNVAGTGTPEVVNGAWARVLPALRAGTLAARVRRRTHRCAARIDRRGGSLHGVVPRCRFATGAPQDDG